MILRQNKKKEEKLELELTRVDLPITVEELLVVKILSASALAFLTYAISKDFILISMVFLLLWNIPKLIITKKKSVRVI
jgi:tight adherence protein B